MFESKSLNYRYILLSGCIDNSTIERVGNEQEKIDIKEGDIVYSDEIGQAIINDIVQIYDFKKNIMNVLVYCDNKVLTINEDFRRLINDGYIE